MLKKEIKDFQKEEGRGVEVLKEGRMAMEEQRMNTEERELMKESIVEGREEGT